MYPFNNGREQKVISGGLLFPEGRRGWGEIYEHLGTSPSSYISLGYWK
jgi:hypothetical protein